jgi:hypothetical protein
MRRVIALLFWGIVGVVGVPVVGIVCWIALSSFTGLQGPATAPLAAARPITQSTQGEMISAIVTTYRQNEARFRHEYVGRLFSARMRLSRVTENVIGETSILVLSTATCRVAQIAQLLPGIKATRSR